MVGLIEALHNGLRLRRHLQRLHRRQVRRETRRLRRRRVLHAHGDVWQGDGLGLYVARRLRENVMIIVMLWLIIYFYLVTSYKLHPLVTGSSVKFLIWGNVTQLHFSYKFRYFEPWFIAHWQQKLNKRTGWEGRQQGEMLTNGAAPKISLQNGWKEWNMEKMPCLSPDLSSSKVT